MPILGLMLVLAFPARPAPAVARVERVFPVFPEHGEAVGPRVVLELGYESPGQAQPRDLRFRIRLEPLRGKRKPYVFDQRRRSSGWLVGDEERMLYRPRKPLQDGLYRFEVEAWNGLEWIAGTRSFEIRIDSVPPAEVEALSVLASDDGTRLILEWDPVTLDLEGGPEFVSLYHVYRFERRWAFRTVRPYEIGSVEAPRFVDTDPRPADSEILFYRVTAEDAAGNEGRLAQ